MQGLRAKCKAGILVVLSLWISLAAFYGFLKPVPNACVMTYMYPTYIPISTPPNLTSVSSKYGLYVYHEGWRKIDFQDHLNKLNGVPLLFIPGNGGSYKQVRSLAAESDRAYQAGPPERTFYQEASIIPEEGGGNKDVDGSKVPNQYSCRLNWFTVDLEEEHSAMDGQIVEEQTEYVVYAIHRILDQYKESRDGRSREGAEPSGSLPRSVILVGHSMGGFVARAAVVHPHLRKAAVETVVTLSSPHQSPPLALQPALGHYFSLVNQEWRKGYEVQLHRGHLVSEPTLSHVVVISVSGGPLDYQVRPKLESLDGIVPRSHGFMIGSMSIRNVWLSMEHQTILWCNQLVVQVSHTLLNLIDSKSGHPFLSTHKRLAVFTKMLHSGIPQSFKWTRQVQPHKPSIQPHVEPGKNAAGSHEQVFSSCPQTTHWNDDGLEKDLYIQGTTVTVLAMDGRRRWLDVQKLGSNGKNHFIFVTNLAPCSGVRLHLWPEKRKIASELSPSKTVLEVTSKLVQIPAGPAPTQMEPGSQTEQAPPSSVFQLGPEDMHGFRFLTISVAPRPTVSGRPPPATSMAVGQFFNPEEGRRKFSPGSLLISSYAEQEMLVNEDHPLLLNLSFSVSLGLLPVTLSVDTTGCGIKSSGLPIEEAGDLQHSRLCKLRCFPPVAVAWDHTSGLHIVPNMYSETIVVDSSPAFWDSTLESDMTTVLLLVDPHCSFKVSASVSFTAAAGRFLLLYSSQIIGFSIAVIFFALMRQARSWELDLPLPSLMAAMESNLRMPLSFLLLAVAPIMISLLYSFLNSQPFPPVISFFVVSILCYTFANGCVILLILTSQVVFYVAANIHTFIKIWLQVWEESSNFTVVHRFLNLLSSFFSFKKLRILRDNPTLATAVVAIILVCFVHPAAGLAVLLLSHSLYCHTALCSFLAASFRSHARKEELLNSKTNRDERSWKYKFKSNRGMDPLLPLEENSPSSPNSTRSYSDTQIEIFNHRHGLLILHLLAALLFAPSFVAWLKRREMGHSLPWLLDSLLCVGVILHGICCSKPEYNSLLLPFLGFRGQEVGLSFVYLLGGFYCYLSGLALAPYRAFYAMALIGVISGALRILERRNRVKGEIYFSASRRHYHRH